jgi:hypothetical protein
MQMQKHINQKLNAFIAMESDEYYPSILPIMACETLSVLTTTRDEATRVAGKHGSPVHYMYQSINLVTRRINIGEKTFYPPKVQTPTTTSHNDKVHDLELLSILLLNCGLLAIW